MKKRMTLLAALALALTLLAGCGGGQEDTAAPPAEPAPVQDEAPAEPAPTVQPEDKKEDETLSDVQPETTVPEETESVEAEPAEPQPEEKENGQSEEAPPAPAAEPEPAPAEPEPVPEPAPEPEPEETVPEDGVYTASVTLEGGSGRATVESPATLRCEGGTFWAVIVWSSPNFDYMKVDGEKYPQTNAEGNSTFEIPVSAFDQKLDVIADTVAMSEPHEVEYTLTFDSASLTKQ